MRRAGTPLVIRARQTTRVEVVEFYNRSHDHYFVTAYPAEIQDPSMSIQISVYLSAGTHIANGKPSAARYCPSAIHPFAIIPSRTSRDIVYR